jgi:hypothetical protein
MVKIAYNTDNNIGPTSQRLSLGLNINRAKPYIRKPRLLIQIFHKMPATFFWRHCLQFIGKNITQPFINKLDCFLYGHIFFCLPNNLLVALLNTACLPILKIKKIIQF